MCYAKPGPRCTYHTKKDLMAAQHRFATLDNDSSEESKVSAEILVKKKLLAFYSSPGGIDYLQKKVKTSSEEERHRNEELLVLGKITRENQINEYNTAFPDKKITNTKEQSSLMKKKSSPHSFSHLEQKVTRKGLPEDDTSHQELNEKAQKWREGLTKEEHDALRSYQFIMYKSVNHFLRDKEGFLQEYYSTEVAQGDTESVKKSILRHQKLVDELDSALASFPSQNTPQRLYRYFTAPEGVTAQEYVGKNFEVGKEVSFDGYLSTSIDPDVAIYHGERRDEDRRVIFEIMSSKGAFIQKEGSTTAESIQQKEKEVLLPRNQKFVVANVLEDVKYSQTKKLGFWSPSRRVKKVTKYTVVQLSEVI